MRHVGDAGCGSPPYRDRMLRIERSDPTATVSDRELGIGVLLLLVAMVLTVSLLPATF